MSRTLRKAPLLLIPLGIILCAWFIVAKPSNVAPKADAQKLPALSSSTVAVAGTAAEEKAVTTPGATTADTGTVTKNTSANTTPTAAPAPAAPPKAAALAAPSTDCPSLIKSVTTILITTVNTNDSLLNRNLKIVGLSLGYQNSYIDSYNKNVKAAYDSADKEATDKGCKFTAPAPKAKLHITKLL